MNAGSARKTELTSTVLIIDDDPTQRLLACSVVAKAGYKVVQATDGEEGLEMARLSKPDLIVCDVQMPGLDGYQLLDAIRRDAELADTPFIMLTVLSQRANVRLGMTTGADDYLAKPFHAFELQEAIGVLLARRMAQKQRLAQTTTTESGVNDTDEHIRKMAFHYEVRLANELNKRWFDDLGEHQNVAHDNAVVVITNLFEYVTRQDLPDEARVTLIRQLHQKARDIFYLFGARHFLIYGDDILCVFTNGVVDDFKGLKIRAVRAAFALRSAFAEVINAKSIPDMDVAAEAPQLQTALATGSVVISKMGDAIDSHDASLLASGAAVQSLRHLQAWAKTANWAIVSQADFYEGLAAMVTSGHRSLIKTHAAHPSVEAFELQSLIA